MKSDRDQILFNKTLTYANGYRELGMFDDALAELDEIGEKSAGEKQLHQMRLAILMEAQRWKKALPIANILAFSDSSDPGNFVNLAYVTRRADNIEGARIILENAARQFPKEAIIQYNLGCYACCNGELDIAKSHLLEAFKIDPAYFDLSQTDADLTRLKDWIATIPKPSE